MSNIRIERIKLHNFKGVDDLDFQMGDGDAIILGGKNGFGKTTIFDAIELVLTGRIDRYSAYKEAYTDLRRALSQEERPLVCSRQVAEVRIDLYLTIVKDDGQVVKRILTRMARTAAMKNPVDFDVFRGLAIREKEDDEPAVASQEELDALGLTAFRHYYTTLNYMSQEESTRFIKSKEVKRREDVQFIFNTEAFDRRINKIDKVLLKALKEKTDAVKVEKQQKEQTIQALRQYNTEEAGDATAYLRIFDGMTVKWDAEALQLSNEEYAHLLSEGGELDRIQYVVAHGADYNKWWKSMVLSQWLEQSGDHAFYLQYKDKEKIINQWKESQRTLGIPFSRLELRNINEFQFVVGDNLLPLLEGEGIEEISNMLQQVRDGYRISSASQRAYQEMVAQRDRLAGHLKNHAKQIGLQRCPLCGQNYETMQKLLESIENTLTLQLTSFDSLNERVMADFNKLKQLIKAQLERLDGYFTESGINAEIVGRYDALDKLNLEKHIKKLTDVGLLDDLPRETVEETERRFKEDVQSRIEAYDKTLNYDEMKRTADAYVRYIPKNLRIEEVIWQKRAYLLQNWSKRKSQQMNQLTQEVSRLTELLTKYDNLKGQLETIKNAIAAQKETYLKRVITDVEILFYIYSGRIMQDNFYGRGLFMKNEQGKYIYFVTQYDSDVDALYKMSSGQLVALMMALLLSLNKLYSESHFLAIDDPVQTIDDINVWGFVETLRHEFKDYQFLFSTHELSYGSFLRYKLSNMSIAAQYVDMMEARK